METPHRKTALITGASAGIGQAFARELARRGGYDLILVARRRDHLEALRGELSRVSRARVEVVVADLTLAQERDEVVRFVEMRQGGLDLLINNAGFGSFGEFTESDLRRELEMVALNVQAPLHLVHALAPKLARSRGVIVNVCSTCSFQPLPFMATYAASKAFLLSFSAAIAAELRPKEVHVCALCPGPTATEFHIAAGLSKKIALVPAMSAEAVVCTALRAIERRRFLVVCGALNKALAVLSWLVPPRLSAALVRRALK